MANNYLQAAFAVTVTASEARLIAAVLHAVEAIDSGMEGDEAAALTAELGPEFAAAFPGDDANPLAGVMSIFPDPDFPCLDADVRIEDGPEADTRIASFSGDQFGVEQVANLLFACAKSAFPIGFQYAFTCDRLRHDEFGGGAVVITDGGIHYHSTSDIIRAAIDGGAREEGRSGFVLATRDRDHGLSFWSNETGFGRLAEATVFSEAEAAEFDKPIAADEPEWLACPTGAS